MRASDLKYFYIARCARARFYERYIKNKNPLELEACKPGQFVDSEDGCVPCPENSYNSGGTNSECTKCPEGKEVAEGAGTQESDCKGEAI